MFFLEVLLVFGNHQTQRFWGPFKDAERRNEFRQSLQEQDKLCYEKFGYQAPPSRIKYISCGSLPPGDWKKEYWGDGVYFWFKAEDVGDWHPSQCPHREE